MTAPPNNNGRNGRALTDWGVLASWAGVLLTLVFGIGGALMAAIAIALADTRASLGDVLSRELLDAEQRGRFTERIDNHGVRLTDLDQTLQREMRLLDDAMERSLIDLDERLQAEIVRSATVGADDRAALRAILEEVRAYQDRAREWNTEQTERLRALERDVYEKSGG